MKFPTGFTYRNLHGFAQFPDDSTALVNFWTKCAANSTHRQRDSARQLSRVGVGGVYTEFASTQLVGVLILFRLVESVIVCRPIGNIAYSVLLNE